MKIMSAIVRSASIVAGMSNGYEFITLPRPPRPWGPPDTANTMWAWSDTAGGHGQYTAGARRPHVHMDYTDFAAGYSILCALR